jgi:hypothetical protein
MRIFLPFLGVFVLILAKCREKTDLYFYINQSKWQAQLHHWYHREINDDEILPNCCELGSNAFVTWRIREVDFCKLISKNKLPDNEAI